MRLIFGMESVNERFPVCWRRQERVERRRRQEPLIRVCALTAKGRNLTLTDIADVSGTDNAAYQKSICHITAVRLKVEQNQLVSVG